MLTVTPAARTRLLAKLKSRNAGQDVILRFSRNERGWNLHPDHARPGDIIYTKAGKRVLVLDPAAARKMRRLTLCVRRTKNGIRLKLRRVGDATSSP